MGWLFRKSVSFGRFRLNFSNRGVGASFGVRGARISINRRGTYVNFGANGIYYRQKFGGGKRTPTNSFSGDSLNDIPVSDNDNNTITTSDVDMVTDADSMEFVKELEEKHNKRPLWKWLGLVPSVIILWVYISYASENVRIEKVFKDVFIVSKRSVNLRGAPNTNGLIVAKAKEGMKYDVLALDSSGWVKLRDQESGLIEGYIRTDLGSFSQELVSETSFSRLELDSTYKYGIVILLIMLIAWCVYMHLLDRARRTLSIFYTLDGEVANLYSKFIEYFSEFRLSKKIWQTLHVQRVNEMKYNAGANQERSRRQIYVSLHQLPTPFLKTNISIPYVSLQNTELFFFPERLILKRGNSFGAVLYKNVAIEISSCRFVEEETLAQDVTVLDYTWKYLNKNGGPDRRFSDNRQLPICLYTDYKFTSVNGLNEVVTTSKAGAMDNFVKFVQVIGEYQKRSVV